MHRIYHRTVLPITAGAILAGLSFSAFAQYPGDNGMGPMPTNPAMQRYGDNYGVVPKAPYAPTTTTRPGNWVGATPPNNSANGALTQTAPPEEQYPSTDSFTDPAANTPGAFNPNANLNNNPNSIPNQILNQTEAPQLIPGTVVLARVGPEPIYAYEVTPPVDRYLAEIKTKMTPDEIELHKLDFEMSREQNIRKALKAQIETKLYFQDVKRDIPPEGMINVEKQLTVQFEKTELPKLMKQEGVTSARDLEKKLNSRCSSIAQEKKRFFRTLLVNEWMRKQIKPDELPTVTQMVHYYEAHKLDTDFTTPAKVRWEELTVNKSKYSNNAEALAAISQLGNRVLVNKEPFDAVAKDASDGFTAMKGGFRDWAAKGSLTDKEIEKALFSSSLPVGQLSQIIETPQDYNIVRVIERVDQKTEDFHSAQDKIRTLIKNERIERQFHEYLDRLEKRTPIWTVYDGNGDGKPLSERLNEDKSPLKTPGANGEMLGRAGRTNEVQR